MVRLRPRQWLDTEDALVPIGAPSIGTGEEPIGEPLGDDTDAKPSAASWAASDFWGEDAARLQDAVQAPVPGPAPETEERPALLHQRPERRRRRGQAQATTGPGARLARFRRTSIPRTGWSAAAVLAASLVVVIAFVTSALVSGVSTAQPARTPRLASHAGNVKLIGSGNQVARLVKMFAPAVIPPLEPPRAHRRKPTKRHVAAPRSRDVYNASSRGITPTVVKAPTYADSAAPSSTEGVNHSTSAPSRRTGPSGPAGPSGPVSLIGAGTSPSG